MKFTARSIRIIGLAALLLIFSFNVRAQADPPAPLPELFSTPVEEDKDSRSADRSGPEVIRMRSADVDFSILTETARSGVRENSPDFVLNLFEDVRFTADIHRIEHFPSGSIGMVGVVDSPEFNELVLVARDGAVQATLQVGASNYEIRYHGSGHTIVEVDQSGYPDSLPPLVPDESIQPQARDSDSVIAADPADEIDVLVVYTPAARSAADGTSAIELRIEQSMFSANVGYLTSGITQRLNLVGTEEVSYNETVPGATDPDMWYYALYRLTDGYYGSDPTNANYLADARAYREQYGADLVMMVANLPTVYCGIAWLAGGPTEDYIGYSVVHVNCTGSSSYTPQHEMGHNMGACHDWANPSSGCYFNYSHGYWVKDVFYTVMSYGNKCGTCTRINRWSNPDLTYKGYPTGVPINQPNPAHNTLTLNNTAINVANYRQSLSHITGSFVRPGDTKRLLIPRTHLEVSASSSAGSITSVEFKAYYDGGWDDLGIDHDGSDGWGIFWLSGGISEQTIMLAAIITDSTGKSKPVLLSDVVLSPSHISIHGYETRGGGGEGQAAPPELEPAGSAPETEAILPVFNQKEAPRVLHYAFPGASRIKLH